MNIVYRFLAFFLCNEYIIYQTIYLNIVGSLYFRLGPSYYLLQEKWKKGWKLQLGWSHLHQAYNLRYAALILLIFSWRAHYNDFSKSESFESKQHHHTIISTRTVLKLKSLLYLVTRKMILIEFLLLHILLLPK